MKLTRSSIHGHLVGYSILHKSETDFRLRFDDRGKPVNRSILGVVLSMRVLIFRKDMIKLKVDSTNSNRSNCSTSHSRQGGILHWIWTVFNAAFHLQKRPRMLEVHLHFNWLTILFHHIPWCFLPKNYKYLC